MSELFGIITAHNDKALAVVGENERSVFEQAAAQGDIIVRTLPIRCEKPEYRKTLMALITIALASHPYYRAHP